MNHYRAMAQRHWARWLPRQYAMIENPDSFFTDLGNRASNRIAELAGQFERDPPPGEEYLDRVGRLGQARRQAEEIAAAGQHLKDRLAHGIAELHGVRAHATHVGSLGGFPLNAAVERSMGKTTAAFHLDGVPDSTVQVPVADLQAADPAGLITRIGVASSASKPAGRKSLATSIEPVARSRMSAGAWVSHSPRPRS